MGRAPERNVDPPMLAGSNRILPNDIGSSKKVFHKGEEKIQENDFVER